MTNPRQWLFTIALYASVLYGASFNEVHHFNVSDPRGLSDVNSYLKMADGNYDVFATHRYRFVIPGTVSLIKQALGLGPSRDVFLFYGVNFAIAMLAVLCLHLFLLNQGVSPASTLLAGTMFLANRVTADSQLPVVDSLYYFGIILVVYLMSTGRTRLLAASFPALLVFKESLLPFPFLLWLKGRPKKWTEVFQFALGLGFAIAALWLTRRIVNSFSPATIHADQSLFEIIAIHAGFVGRHIDWALSISGMADISSAYGFLYFLIPPAFLLARRDGRSIGGHLWGLIPISIAFALLSGNLGRMLFSTFPLVFLLIGHLTDDMFRRRASDRPVGS